MASKKFIIETSEHMKEESSNDVFNKLKTIVGKEEANKILLHVEINGNYVVTGSKEVIIIKKIPD